MSFALIIGILLLNILIAEIGNIYTDMREHGRLAFWAKRLAYNTEISCSLSVFSCLLVDPKAIVKSIKRPRKTKVQSLKQGRIDFATISTWFYKDLAAHGTLEEKDFFLWYLKAKDVDRPPFFKRMRVFLSRASMREIIFPSKSFERVVSKKTYPSRLFVVFFYPLIPIFLIIVFTLGLCSFGLWWPTSLKERLFNGPLDGETDVFKANIEYTKVKVDQLEAKNKVIEAKLDRVLQLLLQETASA